MKKRFARIFKKDEKTRTNKQRFEKDNTNVFTAQSLTMKKRFIRMFNKKKKVKTSQQADLTENSQTLTMEKDKTTETSQVDSLTMEKDETTETGKQVDLTKNSSDDLNVFITQALAMENDETAETNQADSLTMEKDETIETSKQIDLTKNSSDDLNFFITQALAMENDETTETNQADSLTMEKDETIETSKQIDLTKNSSDDLNFFITQALAMENDETTETIQADFLTMEKNETTETSQADLTKISSDDLNVFITMENDETTKTNQADLTKNTNIFTMQTLEKDKIIETNSKQVENSSYNDTNNKAPNIRWTLMRQVYRESYAKILGSLEEMNILYPRRIAYIENTDLTFEEKVEAKWQLTVDKDVVNLLQLQEPVYKCDDCEQVCYVINYCENCLRDCLKKDFFNWTSGNSIIDGAIKDAQLILPLPLRIIEWIPYKDLNDINYKTEGGCAKIYLALWTKGQFKSFDKKEQTFRRFGPTDVILKRLNGSNQSDLKFLMENTCIMPIEGLQCSTMDPENGDFILVMDVMEEDLCSYIQRDDLKMTWTQVYDILYCICELIHTIHSENLVHRDLHPGNLLRSREGMWMISDLGFCGPPNMKQKSIYGNLPFVAPEILSGRDYTLASDIYSVGMLMYEVATGLQPFNGQPHDSDLMLHISKGNRPNIPNENEIPGAYKNIMEKCWDALPENRPLGPELRDFFFHELIKCAQNSDYGGLVKNYSKGKIATNPSSIHPILEQKNATTDEQDEQQDSGLYNLMELAEHDYQNDL